jgi:hypothetical protein
MTVIPFDETRRRPALVPRSRWQPCEVAELMRLYAILRSHGKADAFEYGETDHGDPQFYMLSSSGDGNCFAGISRLTIAGGDRYVAQNETGTVIAECAGDLRVLVDKLASTQADTRRRFRVRLLLAVKTVTGVFICGRAVEGNFAGFAASSILNGPVGENVAAWAPLLLAVG